MVSERMLFSAVLAAIAVVTVSGQLLPPPGDGEIRSVFWDVPNQTEVWLTLEPVSETGAAAPLLTFTHRFAGKRAGEPPSEVEARAYAGNFWAPRAELWFVIDDEVKVELVSWAAGLLRGTPSDYVSAPVAVDLLTEMATATRVTGASLGFPFELTGAQRAAIGEFARRVRGEPR